jgi:hypothetical protein
MGSVAHEPPWRRETATLNGKAYGTGPLTSPGLDESRKSMHGVREPDSIPRGSPLSPLPLLDNVWD